MFRRPPRITLTTTRLPDTTLFRSAYDALGAVEGPAGTRAEMHSTTNANGIMKMAPLKRLPVPAGGHVMLEPGGAHVMLFGLKDVKPGGTAPLTFVFEKGGRVPVTAELTETGARTPAIGGASCRGRVCRD